MLYLLFVLLVQQQVAELEANTRNFGQQLQRFQQRLDTAGLWNFYIQDRCPKDDLWIKEQHCTDTSCTPPSALYLLLLVLLLLQVVSLCPLDCARK